MLNSNKIPLLWLYLTQTDPIGTDFGGVILGSDSSVIYFIVD